MDEEQSRKRDLYIQKIRTAALQDAVFLLVHFNARSPRNVLFSHGLPVIELSEALPEVSQATYERILASIQRLWREGPAVAIAYYKFPDATRTYEEELSAFKANNPGFSEDTYHTVINEYLFQFR
jgi:hypothetical protein